MSSRKRNRSESEDHGDIRSGVTPSGVTPRVDLRGVLLAPLPSSSEQSPTAPRRPQNSHPPPSFEVFTHQPPTCSPGSSHHTISVDQFLNLRKVSGLNTLTIMHKPSLYTHYWAASILRFRTIRAYLSWLDCHGELIFHSCKTNPNSPSPFQSYPTWNHFLLSGH